MCRLCGRHQSRRRSLCHHHSPPHLPLNAIVVYVLEVVGVYRVLSRYVWQWGLRGDVLLEREGTLYCIWHLLRYLVIAAYAHYPHRASMGNVTYRVWRRGRRMRRGRGGL